MVVADSSDGGSFKLSFVLTHSTSPFRINGIGGIGVFGGWVRHAGGVPPVSVQTFT